MEIERKFLVSNIDEVNLQNYKWKQIIQDYLYVDRLTAIRKRHTIEDNEDTYTYTIKTGKKNISVNEFENHITKEEYDCLKINKNYHTINKKRYVIPYLDGLTIELDVFEGEYAGIIFAEIEFKSEEQAKTTLLPKWFNREYSTKLTNSMMATMPIKEIMDMISEN